MVRKLRGNLTYANVMSSIAVFMAMGGVTWAAVTLPKNSVGASQIKKDAVQESEIKKDAVRAAEIKKDAVGPDEVNEASLGQVPTAASADNAANAASAANATNAANAANAAQLAGQGPEAFNIGRAYGYINEGGTVDAARSRNVAGVQRLSLGVYCVTLAAGIDIATVAPITSLDKQFSATNIPPPAQNDSAGFIEWDSVPEDCPAGTLEIDSMAQTHNGSGAQLGVVRSDQSFMLLIP